MWAWIVEAFSTVLLAALTRIIKAAKPTASQGQGPGEVEARLEEQIKKDWGDNTDAPD